MAVKKATKMPKELAEKKATKMPKELAEKEVEKWLLSIGVDEDERGDKEELIQKVISKVSYGKVYFNDDGLLVYKLIFPLKSQNVEFNTTELVFNRINTGQLIERTKGVEGLEYMVAAASLSTGKTLGEIKSLDSKDGMFANTVANFFL